MGLDMYLRGKKFLWTDWDKPENNLMEDNFRVYEKALELGYWRKHPDLHGYIVDNFAGGVDECQEIGLQAEDIEVIIRAVREKELTHKEGFFFGDSIYHYEEKDYPESTIGIFEKALEWVKTKEKNVSRSIVYQASW